MRRVMLRLVRRTCNENLQSKIWSGTMSDYEQSVNDHYSQTDFSSKILKALLDAGKDVDSLTQEDLSSFDQFHSGGLGATKELASLAGLFEGMQVLDIGSGIGGPARMLASEYGCQVTGIDLTEEFCLAAEMLTARLGLTDKVRFQCGNALDLPFDDEAFDLVWMQNSSMNIPDKDRLYSEVRRVLRPKGRLATQDVLSGLIAPLHYPVMWADNPSVNSMITAIELQHLLTSLGFKEVAWHDVTELTIKVQRDRMAAMEAEQPAPLGLGVIVSADLSTKGTNALRNNEEGRTVVVTSVFERG